MRGSLFGLAAAALLAAVSALPPNHTASYAIELGDVKPPPYFENSNLVRTINLERTYPRESVNVVIKNVGTTPQSVYYVPFDASVIGRIGGFEVRDKQKADSQPFEVDVVDSGSDGSAHFYRVSLPKPLDPEEQQTLSITYHTLAALEPLPAAVGQAEKQYLYYQFSAYFPSTYPTLKQKTKVRFPGSEVLAVTKFSKGAGSSAGGDDGAVTSENAEDPVKDGKTYTYGPFGPVGGGVLEPAGVHYEHTRPLIYASLLERDVEVSHWGGNLATEERYWLENRGAALKGQFNRVQWQQSAYYSPPSVALKGVRVALAPGARDPYYTDDIGNVTTSNWNPGDGRSRAGLLDLRPRYPLFGEWRFKFRIGWDRDLSEVLRGLRAGASTYVLRVPFLEGPREKEGVEYAKVVSRVILPEGASNVQFTTTVPLVSSEVSLHRTFMDTEGRSTITLTAVNLNDEARNKDIVVTYDYTFMASLRKPLTILTATFAAFVATWLLSRVDVRIKPRKS